MQVKLLIPALLLAVLAARAQDAAEPIPDAAPQTQTESSSSPAADEAQPAESPYDKRFSLTVLDDATFYSGLAAPLPTTLNQVLVEPSFALRRRDRWLLSASLVGQSGLYADNFTRLNVREAYGGLSAGDLDLTVGRKLVRWGTGYAFTAAGVLDPPRIATNPTDRLGVEPGRDLIKTDWVHGPHAVSLAWSTAELAPASAHLSDTTAFRYNRLFDGFDTALIAGHDLGGDSFGAVTFTRVLGQAWEVHGEAVWREHPAVLAGAKYTRAGCTLIGEYYSPPNIAYYRGATLMPTTGRQQYAFFQAGKARLRELPGWKQWSVDAYAVANLTDRSSTTALDVSRWMGNHFSAYLHLEIPAGGKRTEYGAAPYSAATSIGVRFQL